MQIYIMETFWQDIMLKGSAFHHGSFKAIFFDALMGTLDALFLKLRSDANGHISPIERKAGIFGAYFGCNEELTLRKGLCFFRMPVHHSASIMLAGVWHSYDMQHKITGRMSF
ncbi:hypothetical protein EYY60_16165 [Flavobacterium zhairuonense]|uniref:hypothetical protein n=1 Tax=Flavobacterium zhairuonense TaxID=2493631 RepID=UPI001042CAEF|nr:hypothetical protein [Flavobacterium zhairuonense]KAF2508659.1 hypothetical protein EYY60_16165 [Flavobacterium zhairuonense]